MEAEFGISNLSNIERFHLNRIARQVDLEDRKMQESVDGPNPVSVHTRFHSLALETIARWLSQLYAIELSDSGKKFDRSFYVESAIVDKDTGGVHERVSYEDCDSIEDFSEKTGALEDNADRLKGEGANVEIRRGIDHRLAEMIMRARESAHNM